MTLETQRLYEEYVRLVNARPWLFYARSWRRYREKAAPL